MKIGKPKEPGIAGKRPVRRRGDPKPEGYVFGAPTKYREEYCQALIEYFQAPTSWDIYKDAKGTAKALPVGKLPTFERFAASLGVHRETMINWTKQHPEFAVAYDIAASLQKAFLMELSAAGIGSNNMGLILKVNHGMVEPKEEEHDDKPLEIRIVKAVKPESE